MKDVKISSVTKAFDGRPVLRELSFDILCGAVIRVTGASGIGKTTLLRIICGLEKPDSGEISGVKADDVSILFQEDRLFPSLTALDNVACVIKQKDRREKAQRLLSELSLTEADMSKYPFELSGGMCRRVAIARAIAFDRPMLILDEALRGLDDTNAVSAARFIEAHSKGKTIIFVTHSEPLTSLPYTELSLS